MMHLALAYLESLIKFCQCYTVLGPIEERTTKAPLPTTYRYPKGLDPKHHITIIFVVFYLIVCNKHTNIRYFVLQVRFFLHSVQGRETVWMSQGC